MQIIILENRHKHRFIEIFKNNTEREKFLRRKSPAQRVIYDKKVDKPKTNREFYDLLLELKPLFEFVQ